VVASYVTAFVAVLLGRTVVARAIAPRMEVA